MKIASSAISMKSSHTSLAVYRREESLQFWTGANTPGSQASLPGKQGDDVTLELSEQARELIRQNKQIKQASVDDGDIFEISDKDRLKIDLIEQMLESLTGKKIKIRIFDKLKFKSANLDLNVAWPEGAPARSTGQGWGLRYQFHESYYEQEKVSFSSQGVIKTANGREIDFSVQLNISREFMSRTDISIMAGDAVAIDPLVINFDGDIPGLTGSRFSFDLDCDGSSDQISFARPGSGFLSLDKNGDGAINDGSELFGPGTGNGFAELARYDEDGNGWIDENDAVFDSLRIWTKDEEGKDVLFSLGQKGIGAIYLGNVNTPFSIKDGSNSTHGQLARTGVFLKENGDVGTIQQIDLVI